MKILIVGLGSIGKKHLNILLNIQSIQVAVLHSKIKDKKYEEDVIHFYNEDDAVLFNPNAVIICNPTSLHIDSALKFVNLNCKILIEKPISDSLTNAQKIFKFKDKIRVAYCLRFHPLYVFLGEKFHEERPYKLSFKRSYFLPNWHPDEDYRVEYTAQKKLGGGVVRTLSHEIDLVMSWFDFPKHVIGYTDKVSFLEIDTDDIAHFSFKMKNNTRVNFELDFFSPLNVAIGEAFTLKGIYQWSLESVRFMSYESNDWEVIFEVKNGIDRMYVEQLLDFINFIKTDNSKNCDYNQAINVLKVINYIDEK